MYDILPKVVEMHSNVMLRFTVQALQHPPLCSSTLIGCQHETVRKETILMYRNIPDFFIPCFSFGTYFYPYFYNPKTKRP